MNKSLNLALKGIKVTIFLLGIILVYLTLSNWDSTWAEGTTIDAFHILKTEASFANPLSFVVNLCIWLIVITFAIMLLFWIYRLVTDIKGSMGSLIGIAVIVIISFISYGMASDTIMQNWNTDLSEITPDISKYVGTGIYIAYIMGGITLIAIVATEVRSLIK